MPGETQTTIPDITILYEDSDLLVVDKPAGLVSHPAYKHPNGTLFDAVQAYLHQRGEARPCLLHRLDKDTSGTVLLAKTEAARRHLVRQFERRTIRKTYLALVCGRPDPASGMIDAPLRRNPDDRRRMHLHPQGDPACTEYHLLQTLGQNLGKVVSLVELHPLTGRMHQLRVHLAALGHPIVGDTLYGNPARWAPLSPPRQMLHAHALTFLHPISGERLSIFSPLPADLCALLATCSSAAEALPGEQPTSYQAALSSHPSS